VLRKGHGRSVAVGNRRERLDYPRRFAKRHNAHVNDSADYMDSELHEILARLRVCYIQFDVPPIAL
jgi:hypothetical protein